MELEHSAEDQAIVAAQLGRPVRGQWSVARRCHLGVPMVVENHPRLDDGSPFPTLFWLTCPILVKRLSTLEAEGGLTRVSEHLKRDPDLMSRMGDAIGRYRARRDEHEVVPDSGSPPGGDTDRVKCFHALVAHELAAPPNPVGAMALNESGWPDCVAPCYEIESA